MILTRVFKIFFKKTFFLLLLFLLSCCIFSQQPAAVGKTSSEINYAENQRKLKNQQKELALIKENHLLQSLNRSYTIIALGLLGTLIVCAFFMRRLWRQRKIIKIQNQQLAQANATKNQFFSIIAHDLRGPVIAFQNILKRVEYLHQNGEEGDVEKMLQKVDHAAMNLNALLDNLLNWSLVEEDTFPYQPASINLKDLSNENYQLYKPLAESKGIKLRQHIFSNHFVFADKNSLSTILRNLVSNAIKFSNHGDQVTITAKPKGDKIYLKVEDTGEGMTPEIRDMVYELGEQKTSSGTIGEKGTGLGLVLCKKFVELNKGELDFKSQLGKGTLFSLALPKA